MSRPKRYYLTMDIIQIAERQEKEGLNMETAKVSYKPIAPQIPLELLRAEPQAVPIRLRGLAASSGIVEGPCTVIRDVNDLHTVKDGAILVCDAASPKLGPFMPLLKGLVAGRGGPLSIASCYAREYGVPAVVGVKGITDTLHTGDFVRVDGSKGVVEVIRR